MKKPLLGAALGLALLSLATIALSHNSSTAQATLPGVNEGSFFVTIIPRLPGAKG